MNIGARVKERREMLGYKQHELGIIIKIGRVTINQWEHGTRRPNVEIIPELAKALNCTIKYLITGIAEFDIPENTTLITNKEMIEYQSLKLEKLTKRTDK